MSGRAYLQVEGKWRHVYILEIYEQVTLLDGVVKMARVKLTKASQASQEVSCDRLRQDRPKRGWQQ